MKSAPGYASLPARRIHHPRHSINVWDDESCALEATRTQGFINRKRVEVGKQMIGVDCPTFTDFDRMIKETKPETVIVTTKDATRSKGFADLTDFAKVLAPASAVLCRSCLVLKSIIVLSGDEQRTQKRSIDHNHYSRKESRI